MSPAIELPGIINAESTSQPESAPPADGPVTNLLSFASAVGVDDVFANLGVPYGSGDTPAQAYVTYLAGVGVDDVFANAAGVAAVAGVGDPVATVGHVGDGVVAGDGLNSLGSLDAQAPGNGLGSLGLLDAQAQGSPLLDGSASTSGAAADGGTAADGGPVSNLLSFASSVGVDDAFANLGVPYGSGDTPAQAYVTFLAGVGVDDVFANAAGVGAVAGIGDPVATVGHAGDDVVAGNVSALPASTNGAQFQFPALGGTGTDALVGETGQLAGIAAGHTAVDSLLPSEGADIPVLGSLGEPATGDLTHTATDALPHVPLL